MGHILEGWLDGAAEIDGILDGCPDGLLDSCVEGSVDTEGWLLGRDEGALPTASHFHYGTPSTIRPQRQWQAFILCADKYFRDEGSEFRFMVVLLNRRCRWMRHC